MKIHAYMAKHDLAQHEFAKRIGVTQSMVGHWLSGRCRITAERARQIDEATGGEVSRYELRPDVFGAAPPKPTAIGQEAERA